MTTTELPTLARTARSPAREELRPSQVAGLGGPYRLVLRASLALSLAAGFGLGLYLLLGMAVGYPLPAGTAILLQAHGHAQAFGLMLLFILAVGVHLFPKFHAGALDRPGHVTLGGLLVATGVSLRVLGQPMEASEVRGGLLLAGGVLTFVGALVALYALGRVVRRGEGRTNRTLLPVWAGLSLLGALALNVWVAGLLAQGGAMVPLGLDEAYLHLMLWGFAGSMIFIVSGRVFEDLLFLQPPRESLVLPMQAAWGIGVLGTAGAWLVAPEDPLGRAIPAAFLLAGCVLFVATLRLYERPARPSRMPYVTDTTRTWARLAFAFLLLGAVLNVALPALELVGGGPVPATAVSAARHALAQGFLVPVMVFMAARILPGYSASMLRNRDELAALMATLFGGAALRVFGELFGGYSLGWGAVVAVGAAAEALAFTWFALRLWWASGEPRGA